MLNYIEINRKYNIIIAIISAINIILLSVVRDPFYKIVKILTWPEWIYDEMRIDFALFPVYLCPN